MNLAFATPDSARVSRTRAMAAVLGYSLAFAASSLAQSDPAAEPAVLVLAKVLPAVVNINTERVVRRTVRDPFEDLYAQFFGYYRSRPREIRQTLQSLGSGFIVDRWNRGSELRIHCSSSRNSGELEDYEAGLPFQPRTKPHIKGQVEQARLQEIRI